MAKLERENVQNDNLQIEHTIKKFIELFQNHPLLSKFTISWFAVGIIIYVFYVVIDAIFRQSELSTIVERIFRYYTYGYDYFTKSLFISAFLVFPFFTFKWLNNEKSDYPNSTEIKTGAGSNVTIVHGNYEGLNLDVLELIKNGEEHGYELELLDYMSKYKERLNRHINHLKKSGSVYLIIGLITIIIGVFVLYEIFMGSSGLDALGYFSRLSIVIFIEIAAFFFLRLHSANLLEIKYFHNELSNIDAKMIALKVALLKNDSDTLKFILKELMRTERNQLLKKGETTVELEKIRFDREGEKSLVDTITKILEPLIKLANKESK